MTSETLARPLSTAQVLRATAGDALVIVDVQRDFLPGGALAVAAGEAVIEPLNGCIEQFSSRQLPIVVSRDWHPADHASFKARGGPWPSHCVAGTAGAAFDPGLELPGDALVISKATTAAADAYSAFEGTNLARRLRDLGVRRLFVGGLATDYCVRATVLDARRAGFDVIVLTDAVAAVDANPGDGKRALQQMRDAGAVMARSQDIA